MRTKTITTLLCLGILTSTSSFNVYAATDPTMTEVISEKMQKTIEEIKQYSIDEKEVASEKAQEIVADMDRHIQILEDSIADKKNNMSESMRDAKAKTVIKLKEKRQHVQDWYAKFKNSSRDSWDEIKRGFVRSYNSFQYAYKNS